MADIFGIALLDYYHGNYSEDIKTHSSLEEEDRIPLPYLFRSFEEMPQLEQKALELARGEVLDIGAGSGSHSLFLQEKGFQVTALDSSKGAIEVCKLRGLQSVSQSSIMDHSGRQYDTLLLLMNGIGLAGKIESLEGFLLHLKSLLKPDGQILMDSSDIIYMFDEDDDGGFWVPGNTNYYGEVTFYLEYKNDKSDPFDWLYVDFETLKTHCEKVNLDCELVISGEHYDYLAKLSVKT
ncbi:class I SAM-dependent methyltransferase [Flagellimonas allohymeniacidonis]|uniref:Methyltransferase domain-containing protein n=1 Tax=Flagellimonas allohymeniacidonis TaxID=2517819 RepID=A0A4Q8QI03_9FLAO|nr:methyltransferase domain-containing protein [Allomuricauda hymeniacidonis]TAI49604.1 methyltransferase domain-containing protein [Allomuricauda hymeniacidonis]